MNYTKIAIIGSGAVGSTTAYAILWKNITAEVILIDIDKKRCMGEILDLADTLPFCGASIFLGRRTQRPSPQVTSAGQRRDALAKMNLIMDSGSFRGRASEGPRYSTFWSDDRVAPVSDHDWAPVLSQRHAGEWF